jgi:hypothetical protein
VATIQVPGPPKESFNKSRPISDLLQSQVRHFQHVEAKLAPSLRTKFTSSQLHTENGAAQYIAQMTGIMRSGIPKAVPTATPIAALKPSPKPTPKPPRRTQPLAIAAAATSSKKAHPKKKASRRASIHKRKRP